MGRDTAVSHGQVGVPRVPECRTCTVQIECQPSASMVRNQTVPEGSAGRQHRAVRQSARHRHRCGGGGLCSERRVKNTAEFIEELEAERLRREEELLKAQQTAFIKPAVHSPLATIVPTPPRRYYNVHDPSALSYEGSAALQWGWNTD